MIKEKRKTMNLSKQIITMGVFLGIIVLCNFMTMLITVHVFDQNAVTECVNQFDREVNRVEQNLESIHAMMLAEMGSDTELDKLVDSDAEDTRSLEDNNTISRISALLRAWTKGHPYDVDYAICIPKNGIEITSVEYTSDFLRWGEIKAQMGNLIRAGDLRGNWKVVQAGGNYYLAETIQKNDLYMLCYIEVDKIIEYLEMTEYGESYQFAAYLGPRIYAGANLIQGENINLDELEENSVITTATEKMMIHKKVKNAVEILLVVDGYNTNSTMFAIQIVLWIVMIFIILAAGYFMYMLNKKIIRPIQKFNGNVEEFQKNGSYDAETHYQIKELENASDVMNVMVGTIKQLKIDIYERTLEQQKTRMDFLSLQVQPHFYLNCLNIIFSMAQLRQFSEIQKLISCISVYLRYMFRNAEDFVSVEDEMNHIEKYLEISKIRYQGGFDTVIDMDDKIGKASLPILILQTFVENAIKHTMDQEDEIELKITGFVEKEEAIIVIEDTGDGFDADILKKLREQQNISEGENRIGIMNALDRMDMAFEGKTQTLFSNKSDGGARVEIRFPYFIKGMKAKEETIFIERE